MSAWIWIKKFFPKDEPESPPDGMSRRSFLRSATVAGLGVATGIIAPTTKIFVPSTYIQVPLGPIPSSLGVVGQFQDGLAHVSNYCKFSLGRAALKLVPGTTFNANVVWNSHTPGSTTYPDCQPCRLERV